jgi:hypothetical protein
LPLRRVHVLLQGGHSLVCTLMQQVKDDVIPNYLRRVYFSQGGHSLVYPFHTLLHEREDDVVPGYLRRVYFSMVVTASSIPSAPCFTKGRMMWSLVT